MYWFKINKENGFRVGFWNKSLSSIRQKLLRRIGFNFRMSLCVHCQHLNLTSPHVNVRSANGILIGLIRDVDHER